LLPGFVTRQLGLIRPAPFVNRLALCGCVGLKPTYGRVSARGVIPLSWSLDHVGPLAASVGDAAVVLQAVAGYDPLDVCSADVPVGDYSSALREGTKNLRIGIPRPYFYDDLQDEVRAAVDAALAVIGTLVAEVHDLQLDIPADRTVQAAESHAYHAENVARTPELYQAETVRRIRSGEKISAAEYIQRRQELDGNGVALAISSPKWICWSRLRRPSPHRGLRS